MQEPEPTQRHVTVDNLPLRCHVIAQFARPRAQIVELTPQLKVPVRHLCLFERQLDSALLSGYYLGTEHEISPEYLVHLRHLADPLI